MALACSPADTPEPAATPPTGGVIAAADAQGVDAGFEILAAGGNAVDAAVAVSIALAVVYPEAGNLGGGGFAVLRMGQENAFLDFRETAPSAATRDMYLDAAGNPVAERSLIGGLAVGVPGSPRGLQELHERYGRVPWSTLVAPAIRLAREGFTISPDTAAALVEDRALLERFPAAREQWFDGDNPLPAGTVLQLPELAETLQHYAETGAEAIVTGSVAESIVAAAAEAGGILTLEDLEAYRPIWREVITFDAFGYHFVGPDLPSSGGILTAATFGILERRGWSELPADGAERAHLLAESWRRAYADRFDLGEPSTTLASASDLLAAERLDAHAQSIDATAATPSETVRPFTGDTVPGAREPSDTTPIVVIDGEGNVVSLTTTLNGLFGSGLWVPALGFLNNEMDDFSAATGSPNLYGLVQGDANAVRPGKRMLSSMTPLVAWSDDGALLAAGGRGGSRIPTGVMQVVLNRIVDGQPLAAAVATPRIHHQWLPDRIQPEAGALSAEAAAQLTAWGHSIEERPTVAQVLAVEQSTDGAFAAGTDPRGAGVARAE